MSAEALRFITMAASLGSAAVLWWSLVRNWVHRVPRRLRRTTPIVGVQQVVIAGGAVYGWQHHYPVSVITWLLASTAVSLLIAISLRFPDDYEFPDDRVGRAISWIQGHRRV